ncbi:unnamed protein product [Clonostachys solani]|uniref:Uncharacterized protein n=1 Tax=Clonostachys solani TaxID=160281 RepID=A0A9N9ZJM0_9HYPO|nr:unnamed protein product [Clonostachys solani]
MGILHITNAYAARPSVSLKQIVMGVLLSKMATARGNPSKEESLPEYTTSEAGNPFLDGWYADPDTEIYNGQYWVFPTYSDVYEKQTFLDAFSSPDLVNWTKHPRILTTETVKWAHKAIWAPAPIFRNGKYYLYFGANDILVDEIEQGLVGGIGVGVADQPQGPYVDAIGKPLIGEFHNGAQPIDQDVFIDDDGQAYIYYGGHSHANVAKLNEDMISLGTFSDNTTFKEITPENYVEGSQMIKRNGVYYFMWSEGGWGGPNYVVSYAMSDSPLGPFERRDKILEQDSAVARGSGHHGVIHVPGTEIYYIVYHRRPLSETDGNHRVTCYDRMYFEDDGTIRKVKMLVKDNFADGKMIAWKTSGAGEWAVEDQRLKGTSGGEPAYAFLDTNFTDLVFDATVSSADYSTSVPALIFRASSMEADSSHYWAKVRSDRVEFGITTNSEEEVIHYEDAIIESGEHKLRIKALGIEVSIFVDDVSSPLLVANDTRLATGATGVAVAGEAFFSSISVARAE